MRRALWSPGLRELADMVVVAIRGAVAKAVAATVVGRPAMRAAVTEVFAVPTATRAAVVEAGAASEFVASQPSNAA